MTDQKNMLMAAGLSFLVIVVWQFFFAPPPPPPVQPTSVEQADGAQPDLAPGALPAAAATMTRDEALGQTARVPIANSNVEGSLSLRGGRIDHLDLTAHRQSLEPGAPPIELLEPTGSPKPYYAIWGWTPARDQQPGPMPGPDALWSVESGDRLAPGAPVTLVWENGAGLTFRRAFSVDDHYMFNVRQTVENRTDAPVTLAPYAIVAHHGIPQTLNNYILHEGGVAGLDGQLREVDFDDILELPVDPAEGGPAERMAVAANGWLGFTNQYWMTALAGGPDHPFTAVFKAAQTSSGPILQADMRQPAMTVAPGETAGADMMLFAGAKETRLLQSYERDRGIQGFENAVDWGWFFFLTKPMHWMLMTAYDLIGNMGWAIITLTLVIKTILFPLAWKSFVAMSKMKMLQPEMEKIKERVGDDKMKMQQEMIGLYKREKVNPASGCLPILLQIPIFFSLYKVIFVALELRHAPFIWWINDLSAPDPSSWMNLFWLLPFSVDNLPAFLALLSIGLFPILMGVTMWMQQKLNPAPTDPIQAQIFSIMPFMFMFMLGHFASGLVIYWIANNVLTFSQQYIIMRRQGVDVDFLGNVKRTFKRKQPAK